MGPHQSYGFAPGKIYGQPANLVIREGLIRINNPNIEHVTALSVDGKKLFVLLLNDIGEISNAEVFMDVMKVGGKQQTIKKITELTASQNLSVQQQMKIQLKGYGLKVLAVELQP